MRGRRRLRIAPVGEICRRWVSTLAAKEEGQDSGKLISDVDDNASLAGSGDVDWTPSANTLRAHADPLLGLRPGGSRARFWDDDDVVRSMTPPLQVHQSPSTISMNKIADR